MRIRLALSIALIVLLAAATHAAYARGDAADLADIWAGFIARGLGVSASIQDVGGHRSAEPVPHLLTEAFGLPNLQQTPAIYVSDFSGDNDGYPEPGEIVTVHIPLTNSTGTPANGVAVQLIGGGSAGYGNIASNSSRTAIVPFTVPANAPCGGLLSVQLNVTSSLGPVTFTRQIFIGKAGTTIDTENFDAATAPTLPNGWIVSTSQGGISFVSTTASPDTPPNSIYARNPSTVGGGTDLAPSPLSVTSTAATMTFRHSYNTEAGWDGGVLEMSIAGGEWQDFKAAGGVFTSNGYNGINGAGINNPLASRESWTGNSNGYVTTVAQFPATANGRIVQLRFRFGADDNTAGSGPNPGWFIDNVSLSGSGFISTYRCSLFPDIKSRSDFDGDGRTDISIYRPSDGKWWLRCSYLGDRVYDFGLSQDRPLSADFDGDWKADLAIWRPANGQWWRINSSTSQVNASTFGQAGDIPHPVDMDGDGIDDLVIFRPETGTWWWQNSTTSQIWAVRFGLQNDIPVAADYDGDGLADISVFRPSDGVWYRINSETGQIVYRSFGLNGDIPVNADYDGDDIEDIAVFRPSNGNWYIWKSSDGETWIFPWGLNGDIPVPGDYDGNGSDEIAIYRNGLWYIDQMNGGGFTFDIFGSPTDLPIPRRP